MADTSAEQTQQQSETTTTTAEATEQQAATQTQETQQTQQTQQTQTSEQAATTGDFPADWRERLANGDEKFLGILKRYASPTTFGLAYKNLRQSRDSGELRAKLSDSPTDDELKAYRKENGIPDTHEGYTMPEGLVIGDDDKPYIDGFLKDIHGAHATPAQAQTAINSYFKIKEQEQQKRHDLDVQVKTETEDALRDEWGADFRGNSNAIHNLLAGAPESVRDGIKNARMADGTPLASHADTLRWLAQLALDANPAATVVQGAGAGTVESIDTELNQIRERMRKDRAGYNKDTAMQDRFAKLLAAKEKLGQRAA